MRLNQLHDRPGARKNKKRLGRGIGSGKGKTCGRGVKGQKSRSGVALKGFEGGQMPLYRRLPKRGFKAHKPKIWDLVNLDRLQEAIDAGKLDPQRPIGESQLVAAGLVRRQGSHPTHGVKLLGRGELKPAVDLTVAHAARSAREAVEKAGGTLTLVARKAPQIRTEADKP